MKIVRHKTNYKVPFADKDFSFVNGKLVCSEFKAPTVTEKNYEIIEVDSKPADWVGGWYTYNGKWINTQYGENLRAEIQAKIQAKIDKKNAIVAAKTELKAIKEDAKNKQLSMSYLDKRLTRIEIIMGL